MTPPGCPAQARRAKGRHQRAASRWRTTPWLVASLVVLGGWLGFVHGCRPPAPTDVPTAAGQSATLRLVLLSNLAGALEPCGCTEDQLGGLDHLAALVAQQRREVPKTVLLAAGALLYDTPKLEPERASQDRLKAQIIARSMQALGLTAWSPGAADFAAGPTELQADATASGAALLAANLDGAGMVGSTMVQAGALSVGVIGVSDPQTTAGSYPTGLTPQLGEALVEAVRQEAKALQAQGARLLVGLASLRRGDALRLGEMVDDLNVLLVGDPAGQSVANDEPLAPMLIGSTLVVQAGNHGQTAAVVDIVLAAGAEQPGPGSAGVVRLSDAGGVARAEQLDALSRRIRALETRINSWERGGKVDPDDLAARRAELASLQKERTGLAAKPLPEVAGSSFRYAAHEIRERLGADPLITEQLTEFYRQVNEQNRRAFANRKPPALAPGQAGYVGAKSCASCHRAAYDFWLTRPHARAYQTLQKQFKEYNLECVGCHVTGYERPGGSTVTHNGALQNVQCEECHGPGSLHLAEPDRKGLIELNRPVRFCVDACHHSPHVESFDGQSKLSVILGPGHGR